MSVPETLEATSIKFLQYGSDTKWSRTNKHDSVRVLRGNVAKLTDSDEFVALTTTDSYLIGTDTAYFTVMHNRRET
jgi:hypothetical protein